MTEDESLKRGISNRLIDNQDFLHSVEWNRLAERGAVAGTCRRPKCGGLMRPLPTHQEGKTTWYSAECMNCGNEIAAPDGRVLQRSGRRNEMPSGWWDRRTDILAKLAELAKGSTTP